ncbi:MAG: hypothetical protein DHS20C13_29380 [Thermodesulfobacteriota bacterium]|nr:MAG: hypothetical protein DHS20C13_29380 [Thermodesulfobacteriota bacterium]GJM36624.1 MAG: hypothetical protein DHS20C18_56250 [Saprospiraceae bacterium]
MKPSKRNDYLEQLVEDIKVIVSNSKQTIERTVNNQLLNTYWQIGRIIVERENEEEITARQLVLDISKALTKQLGKGFSRSNLFNMRSFYQKYPDVQTLPGHISWSHLCELLSIEDGQKRAFYEQETSNSKWSVRELKRQIESSLFEKLLLSKGEINKKELYRLSKKGQIIEKPGDLIKEPYVLEFLGIPENKPILEKDLERKLIRHIEDFLLELGRGFMFVGSQQRITIGNIHHYVDMVFYNKILKAFILIDLKMGKLKPANIGQMNAYLNYYKTEINESIDTDPIGIILCADKDEIIAEYALGGLANQIFASKYVYYLPNKAELINQVQRAIKEYKEEEE